MVTKNPRVNVTLGEGLASLLAKLATQEQKSVSTLSRELILEALELREDMALSALAEARDIPNIKRIKHSDDVWA
jgi:hypothetical protein